MSDNNEFYIGWMQQAPKSFARHTRKVIIGLAILVPMAAFILAFLQKRFSASRFEFGQLTQISGIYQQEPVPSVKVKTAEDAFGHTSYITIPLVGYGKFGAEAVILDIEKENNISLDKKEVSFRGTLLYSDGKTLLQIDGNDSPLVKASEPGHPADIAPVIRDLGVLEMKGEILDPKCYFGVMNPGQGKPHRDCAIRCIAGGMSPVLYVNNGKGSANYYLIKEEKGKAINDWVKDYIAEPVSFHARAVQYDDWIVLYLSDSEKINRLGGLSWFKIKDGTISCGPGTP